MISTTEGVPAAGLTPEISLTPHQITTFLLCAMVALIDGFDTQAIALAAPEIATAWEIEAARFGSVFAAGLFGALFGALGFGMAADRFGRKPSLIVAILLFGAVTLLTPFATSLTDLFVIRFVTGLGLGGALPGVIAVTSEYAPPRRRATIVSLMFCGFPLGAVIGGIVAAQLIPTFGWPILFYIGGVVPLLLLPLVTLLVPESMRFLLFKEDHAAADRVKRRMNFLQAEEFGDGAESNRAPIFLLFSESKLVGTSILTVTFLLSLMLAYFLVNWLPLLARQAGVGMEGAVLGVAALNLGAILGCLVIGRLADRMGPTRPIGWGYLLGAFAIAVIGASAHSTGLLLLTCFIAGALSIGAQMCVVALGASFYETAIRATGIGWLMGTGRIGAIMGPVLGGLLIGAGMSAANLFVVAGGVSLLAAIGVFAMGRFVLGTSRPASV